MSTKNNICGCSSCGQDSSGAEEKQNSAEGKKGQASFWHRLRALFYEEKMLASLSGLLLLLGWLLSYRGLSPAGQNAFFLAAALIGGAKIFRKAVVSLF